MLQKDAIARYYGLEKGQVVKVTYSGEITESHVTYRCIWWCFLLCGSLLCLSSGSCRILCIFWCVLYGHFWVTLSDPWYWCVLLWTLWVTMILAPTFLKRFAFAVPNVERKKNTEGYAFYGQRFWARLIYRRVIPFGIRMCVVGKRNFTHSQFYTLKCTY